MNKIIDREFCIFFPLYIEHGVIKWYNNNNNNNKLIENYVTNTNERTPSNIKYYRDNDGVGDQKLMTNDLNEYIRILYVIAIVVAV